MLEEKVGSDIESVRKARAFLRSPRARYAYTPYGIVVVKGNWAPPLSDGAEMRTDLHINGLKLDLTDCLLHERVLILKDNRLVKIRSHQEALREITTNIGEHPVEILYSITSSQPLRPHESVYSIIEWRGFCHGYRNREPGMIYVAKALKPNFVRASSFRIPLNTYQGLQPVLQKRLDS